MRIAPSTGTPRTIAQLAVLVSVICHAPAASAAICAASQLSCPPTGLCIVTGTWDVGSGCTLDFGPRSVEIRGTLQAATIGGSFRIVAGDLTLNAGKLKSVGDLDDRGGDIQVDLTGAFEMKGSGPRIDTAGNGGGGGIVVNATTVGLLTGVVTSDGGSGQYCGDAGIVSFIASTGPLTLQNTIRTITPGGDCAGGEVSLLGTAVTLSGEINARGGAYASDSAIFILATVGDLVATASATLSADGTGQPDGIGADGGDIYLDAEEDILLEHAALSATGKSPEGAGGTVTLNAGGDVEVNSPVIIYAGSDGYGGCFEADSKANLTVRGDIIASGGEADFSLGGDITLFADETILVESTLDNAAFEAGVMLIEGGFIDVASGSSIVSRGARGQGGTVYVEGCGVELDGSIDTGGSNGGRAGFLSVTSLQIGIGATAEIASLPCAAGPCVQFRTTGEPAVIDPLAEISPAPTISVIPPFSLCIS